MDKSIQNLLFSKCGVDVWYGVVFFKSKLLDRLYETKHNKDEKKDYNTIIQDYLAYVAHKSNSFINLIFGVNLISILLISLTSPIFRLLTPKPRQI